MEADAKQNRLEESFMSVLACLVFVEGKPQNAEVVAAKIAMYTYDYFLSNGGDPSYTHGYIQNAFLPLEKLFADIDLFVTFLQLCISKIEALKTSVRDNTDSDEADDKIYSAIDVMESGFSRILRNTEARPIDELYAEVENIDPKLPIDERHRLTQQARLKLAEIAKSGKLVFDPLTDRKTRKILTPEMCATLDRHADIGFLHPDNSISDSLVPDIMAAIASIEKEKEIMDKIGRVDKAEFEKDRLRFGAKGANLLTVRKVLQNLTGGGNCCAISQSQLLIS